MEIIKLRHLCNLFSQKVILTLLFAAGLNLSNVVYAQDYQQNYNYLDFQKKPYYFGITLGLNTSRYRLNHSQNFISNDSISVAEGIMGPGFNVHVIGNLKIGEFFDFRFLPGFSFAERNIEYSRPLDASGFSRRRIESVFFEAPFHIRYKSVPYKDKRAFVVAGIKYSYDVASNSKTRQASTLVKISPHDFQFEVGAGMQFFFPYFIFSPEFKFSQGLGNTLIYNNELNEARILEKVISRVFTISFHFEG